MVVGILVSVAAGCSGDSESADETSAVTSATTETAAPPATQAATDDVIVIDVRTPDEYAAGHLDGAVNIDATAPGFRDELGDLDTDAAYLVYCRSGNRSAAAAAVMAELGFTNVTDGGAMEAAASKTGRAIVTE